MNQPDETNIPNLPLKNGKPPRAFIRVDIATMIPRDPNNPDAGGDEGRADPIIFPIHESKPGKEFELPQGMLADLRKLFEGVVKHCRTYEPKQPEPMELPTPANDVLVTGAAPEAPPGAQRPTFTIPGGPTEIEQGICQGCGWRETECQCEPRAA